MNLETFERNLYKATNLIQLNHALKSYLAKLGITTFSFTYYAYHPKSNSKLKYDFASDNLKSWHDHYVAENYDEVDSTLDTVYRCTLPIYWELEQQLKDAKNEKEKQMRLDSIAFGAQKGLSIPIHGPNDDFAILMVEQLQGENCLSKWYEVKYELLTAAHYYHHYIKKHLLKNQPEQLKNILSQRELQCLTLLAKHYSVAEIAKNLHITERTVNYHIQKINKKFGMKNKYQSVAEAIRLGLLTL